MQRPHFLRASLATLALTLGLVGCGSAAEPAQTSAPASTEEATAIPESIAAIGYEATEVLAALGLADHISIMPEAVMNPVLGSHAELLSGVETTYAVEMELTAEAIIDVSPDLAILTPRHGAEERLGAVLAEAGIDTLIMPNTWSTPEDLITNVRLIGETVGAEDEAEALATELEEGLQSRATTTANAPEVLILTNQAGRPFITAGRAFPVEMLRMAGAVPVSDTLGIDVTGPIAVEQILAADPDGVILIDMNGSGDRLFTEIITHEAFTGLDGMVDGNVLRVEGRDVQALGLTATVTGLDTLTEWVESLSH